MQTHPPRPDIAALSQRLLKRARKLGAQKAEAEDLAQEAVLRLMQRMAGKDVDAPEHYAMIILQNLIRAQWHHQSTLVPLEEDAISTPPTAHGRLAVAQLHSAIAALPSDQAQIMHLVTQGEHSPRDIATQLDLPIGTVMSRLARARAKLRNQIGLEVGTPIAELL